MTLVSLRLFLPCPSKRNETRAPDTVSIFGDLGRSGGPWWLVQWVGTSTSKSLLSSHRPPSSVLGGGTFIIIFTWVPSGRNEGTNGLHMGSRHLKKKFKLWPCHFFFSPLPRCGFCFRLKGQKNVCCRSKEQNFFGGASLIFHAVLYVSTGHRKEI